MTKFALARAAAAGTIALTLMAGGASTADAGHGHKPSPRPKAPVVCETNTTALNLLAFNDFHGRIAKSQPDTVAFFGTVEAARKAAGEKNTLLLSSGDNVGASLFPSAVQDDNPTIDILNAMDVDSSTVGNHELDRGWDDFAGRITDRSDFPYLAANLYKVGTTKHAVQPYAMFSKNGLKVAVVGAVTEDLPSLVGTEVFKNVSVGDPVEAVNLVTDQLTDGNAKNGEADVVIASYHEGAASGEPKTLDDAMANKTFADIVNNTSSEVAAIFTAHTHQTYAWQAPIPGTSQTRPVVQSGSYGAAVGQVELVVDNTQPYRPGNRERSRAADRRNQGKGKGAVKDPGYKGTICSSTATNLAVKPTSDVPALVAAHPRVAAVQKLVDQTLSQAAVIGSRVIATSTAPVTRGLNANGSLDNRAAESTMSDMVAQMFYETLGNGDANFIGVQNPGGTRADLPQGEISYATAAAVLPFANTLMTTQLSGAKVKTMLEQQWQTNADGSTPARAYLQLGLSSNVSYTYDESRPAGDRITSIAVNGKAIDPAATYTIGSGNFLITGGDNFRVLAQGTNTRDTGASDLAAWVDWLSAKGTISPDFARQAVSVKPTPSTLTAGQATTFAVGAPQGTAQLDTLDLRSTGAPANTQLVATINGVQVGAAAVSNGQASLSVTVPAGTAKGAAVLVLKAAPSGTTVSIPVTIA